MKTLNMDQMCQLEGGKFWGWEDSGAEENLNDPNCGGGPSITFTRTHYIFWIADSIESFTMCY